MKTRELRRGKPLRIQGVILAGVHAWGDCVLEDVICRPLLPIASRPLIWHILDWIRRGDVRAVSICGNSDTTALCGSLGAGERFGVSLAYNEDVMPRGPAGCARDAALDTGAEVILVIDGTIVPCVDLPALLRAHRSAGAAATLVVRGDGLPEGHPDDGQKPLGIYVFSRSALEQVPDAGYQDIKEGLIPSLYGCGERIVTHAAPACTAWRVTDAASYLAVNLWAVERLVREGALPGGRVRVNDALIDPSARVDASVRFVGPVLVGPDSVIDHGALIVGPTTIGAGCSIGAGAVVSRSAVWDQCVLGAGAILDQCIVTDGVNLEAELVVRQTVYIRSRRSEGRLLDRLASLCRPGQRRARLAPWGGAESHPLRA